jgi:hypothetical protein
LNWVDTVVSLFNSYFPLFYLMILIILWEAVSVQALVSAAAAQPLSGGSYLPGNTGLNGVGSLLALVKLKLSKPNVLNSLSFKLVGALKARLSTLLSSCSGGGAAP